MENQKIIAVRGLSKRFGSASALKEISFEVERGEIYGIIGPSGAGKSTLIHCLTALQEPSAGAVLIEGEQISHLTGASLRRARRKIGMVFQHFSLFSSRTALENVVYPMEIEGNRDEKRALELLGLVGLSASAHLYPSQLSGGQKQRVAIARALATSPSLLLCDEPTSALDPESTNSLLQLLLKLKTTLDLTIVIITHEMSVIRQICTKIAVLDKGEIVEEGRVLTLFSHPKHPTTRSFLQNMSYPAQKAALFRFCFIEGRAEKPYISYLVKNYPVEINILSGNIEKLQEGSLGNLIVELKGEKRVQEEICKYLEDEGVIVEALR